MVLANPAGQNFDDMLALVSVITFALNLMDAFFFQLQRESNSQEEIQQLIKQQYVIFQLRAGLYRKSISELTVMANEATAKLKEMKII